MVDTEEVGLVKSVRNFLVYLEGMPTVKVNDLVVNDQGLRGWVSALLPDLVEVLLLDEGRVQPGQLFRRLDQKLTIPVGDFLLGRVINPIGIPIDGKAPLAMPQTTPLFELDRQAPGLNHREFIRQQFVTGVTLIDTLIPIGQGQRELVLGDARSGKADLLVDIIVNQKNTGVICIYASIGKPLASVRGFIDLLGASGALSHTIVVATSSTDIAPLIFLTPQTAFSIAEYFQNLGKDVLLILNDMGNHAKIYREISLLGGRSPGRESYPGDIFYQHSHLLERAGKFKKEAGGGSITALPAIEFSLSDFTTFIPTNLMSMTDGHFLFRSALYNQGQRPAIDIPLSVSRVGQQTQNRIQNLLSARIKQVLARAAQFETVSRFSFELPYETRLVLLQRDMVEEFVKQPPRTFIPLEVQTALLALPFTKFMQDKDREFVKTYREALLQAFLTNPKLTAIAKALPKMTSEQELIEYLDSVTGILTQLTTTTAQKGGKPNANH